MQRLREETVAEINNTGTFAATTDNNFSALPYHRAKSFRLTNLTGKVVGIRLRHNNIVVDNLDDTDFSEWTGSLSYETAEIEGTGSARVSGQAYRSITDQVMLDGSEVDLTIRTPMEPYSIKISILDDITRLGMDGAGEIVIDNSNTKGNTQYKVTFLLNPEALTFEAYLAESGKDRVLINSGAGVFGPNQMVDSIIHFDANKELLIDSLIYRQKVSYSVEHIGHGGSFSYPCKNEISEYEIVNLGSDVMGFADNTQTVSVSGFYAR